MSRVLFVPSRRTCLLLVAVAGLTVWFAAWGVFAAGSGGGGDWPYFRRGAGVLFSRSVLHTYALHPELQIGPLALALAKPLLVLGGPQHNLLVAQVVMTAAAVTAVLAACLAAADRRAGARALLAALLLAPSWVELSVLSTHLDDVLVAVAAALAVVACARGRWLWMGLAIGVAVAAKPWGVGVLPLALAAPRDRRQACFGLALLVPLASWLPFVLGDARTVPQLFSVHLGIASDSPLSLLGLAGTAPGWVRPVQLLAGVCVGWLAVGRGRWYAVPVAAFSARLLLDPQTNPYYTSSVLLAAVVCDVVGGRGRIPRWTIACYLCLYESNYLFPGSWVTGLLRVAFCVSAVALVGRARPLTGESGEREPVMSSPVAQAA